MCYLPRKPGFCSEKLPKWYYDTSENKCMPFYYSNCDGNDNRFNSQEECDKTCPGKNYPNFSEILFKFWIL